MTILADQTSRSRMAMGQDELVRKMWHRVEHCRRLAIATTDQLTAAALIQMANEGEADIRRLMSEPVENASVPSAAPKTDPA